MFYFRVACVAVKINRVRTVCCIWKPKLHMPFIAREWVSLMCVLTIFYALNDCVSPPYRSFSGRRVWVLYQDPPPSQRAWHRWYQKNPPLQQPASKSCPGPPLHLNTAERQREKWLWKTEERSTFKNYGYVRTAGKCGPLRFFLLICDSDKNAGTAQT